MNTTRRRFIIATGGTIASASAAASVTGQDSDDPNITFGEINEEEEYVILHNEEDTEIDIEGLWMNWEHGQEVDQYDQFSEEYGATSIETHDSIKVATGYVEHEDADVDFERDAGAMNDDGSDTYTVESEDKETIIAKSDEDRHDESGSEEEEEEPEEEPEEEEKPEEEGGDEEEETPTEEEEEDC